MTTFNRFKLFGTWKNCLTVAQAVDLADAIVKRVDVASLPFELVLCPPMVALEAISKKVSPRIPIAAQNMVWEDTVSFTGETSAAAIVELGCKYVILGHSERRIYLGEDDPIVSRKAATAVKFGLIPIICIGELVEDYKAGRTEQVVTEQMKAVLPILKACDHPSDFVIAYEPAWAISTSREPLRCEPHQAEDNHRLIREIIEDSWNKQFAESVSIVYGGSANPKNAPDYFSQPNVDGGLVGTASQTADSFEQLIRAGIVTFGAKQEILTRDGM